MQPTTIRWGIIGCGDVTEKKSGPAFNKATGSTLTAVMRRDFAKARDYAARHGVPLSFADADELIHHPEVDAVYIATPPGAHHELALKVAAARKPCYVEKPMARNNTECMAMVHAFEAAQTPLFVAYYRRALPHFDRITKIIRNSSLGQLRLLHYQFANDANRRSSFRESWRFDPEIAGGGLLWDLGSHALDLFDLWCGPLRAVRGHLLSNGGANAVEDMAALNAVSSTGVLVDASWSFISPQGYDTVSLSFDDGIIHASVFGPPHLRIIARNEEAREERFCLPENIQLPLIQNVVDTIQGRQDPLSTGHTAARTNGVLDALKAG